MLIDMKKEVLIQDNHLSTLMKIERNNQSLNYHNNNNLIIKMMAKVKRGEVWELCIVIVSLVF